MSVSQQRPPCHSPGRAVSAVLLVAALASPAAAQVGEEAREAYYRGVADHFGLPPSEVMILSEWTISSEELPLVLLVARRGGVSADAVLALRGAGRSWAELARRYGVTPATLYVPLPEGAPLGALERAYGIFRSTPRREWTSISLGDEEFVELVNLKILSEYLGVPPERVLAVRERTGSFLSAYRILAHGVG